jgi:hypothetical protein
MPQVKTAGLHRPLLCFCWLAGARLVVSHRAHLFVGVVAAEGARAVAAADVLAVVRKAQLQPPLRRRLRQRRLLLELLLRLEVLLLRRLRLLRLRVRRGGRRDLGPRRRRRRAALQRARQRALNLVVGGAAADQLLGKLRGELAQPLHDIVLRGTGRGARGRRGVK